MKLFLIVGFASLVVTSAVTAATISFDLRGTGVPDGVPSGTMTVGGITATLTSEVKGDLNQTSSGFGINAEEADDDTDQIDAGSGVAEAISIYFSEDVYIKELTLSVLSAGDEATLSFNGVAQADLTDTGSGTDVFAFSSGNYLSAGQLVILGHGAGNGFSFDAFKVETVSVPDGGTTLALLFAPVCGLLVIARRK